MSNSRRFRVERPWSQALALEYGFVFVPLTIPEPATPTVFAAPQSYDHRPLLQKPPDWSFEIRKRFVCVHNAWSRQVPFSVVSAKVSVLNLGLLDPTSPTAALVIFLVE